MAEVQSTEDIRKRLREFVSPEEGKRLRELLHTRAVREYKPKRQTSDYLDWIENNHPSFEWNHSQSTNHPYYLTMFSVASQHMAGDCIAECIDRHLDGQPQRY